jgi:predicted enzyme related to lactoylglutathione lyase
MGERTSYPEGTPSWVDVMTSDPEGARTFYSGLFGWDLEVDPDPNTGNYTTARLGGKRVAGLGGQPAPEGVPTVWTTYFATDDVDKTVARVREHGGSVLMEPMSITDVGRMAMAADPTGAVFGLWQAGTHTGAGLVNEPGTFVWNELATRDLDAATKFYGDVLGLTAEDLETGESGMRYRTLHVAGNVAAGSLQIDDSWGEGTPAHWMTYFAVDDTDAAVAKAGELGGSVRVPATDSPHGRFAVLTDPQGGAFTVITMVNADD